MAREASEEFTRAVRERITSFKMEREALIRKRQQLDEEIDSLNGEIEQLEAVLPPAQEAQPPIKRTRAPRRPGRRPTGYTLMGTQYRASTFKGVLLSVCATLHDLGPADFRHVLTDGPTHRYFSEDRREREHGGELRKPEAIGNSGIFVETNVSAAMAEHLCRGAIQVVGLDPSEFAIETE